MIINFSADQSQKLDSHIESSEEIQLVNEESGTMLIFLHVTYFIIYYYKALVHTQPSIVLLPGIHTTMSYPLDLLIAR